MTTPPNPPARIHLAMGEHGPRIWSERDLPPEFAGVAVEYVRVTPSAGDAAASFTPGPWDAQPDDEGAFTVWCRYDDGRHAVVCSRNAWPHMTAQSEANARLIAAAPDLYEALDAAVECGLVPVSSATDGGAVRHSRQVIVADMIRAALAKASGL